MKKITQSLVLVAMAAAFCSCESTTAKPVEANAAPKTIHVVTMVSAMREITPSGVYTCRRFTVRTGPNLVIDSTAEMRTVRGVPMFVHNRYGK